MTKWDTIQEDVKDQYTYLEEEEAYMTEMTSVGDDLLGFSKAIDIDHLTDEELDTVAEMFNMFGDK
jgi:hypothetical protein